MRALILMHAPTEGPGSLGEFLETRGVELVHVCLHAGDPVPADSRGLDAIVSMGGPMNVYEEDRYPFLRDETALLGEAVRAGVPVLGICLGAQLIAKACGARVTRSPEKEVGWGTVLLTEAARSEPLLRGLPATLEVMQWHEDMFEVPAGGVLLARSEACPHQAFRIGNALGLQFHAEATAPMLAEWFAGAPGREAILRHQAEMGDILAARAERLFSNFLELLRASRGAR